MTKKPAHIRGRLTVSFQHVIVTGILVAFFMDYILINTGDNNSRYRMLSMTMPALIFIVLLFFAGASPRWLIIEDRDSEAEEILKTLNSSSDINEIKAEIKKSIWIYES